MREKISKVLELTNLKEVIDLRFNTYSTGMRQMMAFARALLMDAQIIFVDEPTKSLDPQAAQKIRKFLRKKMVGEQGRTVFWATHNLGEAQEYGDELAIIDRGKIKLSGTVTQLTRNGDVTLEEIYNRALK